MFCDIGKVVWTMLVAFWPLWLVVALGSVIQFLSHIYRDRRLAASGIKDIDRMDGRAFEQYLRVVFRRKGCVVFWRHVAIDRKSRIVTTDVAQKMIEQSVPGR